MRDYYLEQLSELNEALLMMGELVENSITEAIDALLNNEMEKAKKAVDADNDIDDKEREIEALGIKLLLRQQPVAGDLRTVSSALKIITDLERIGDQAADISEIALMLDKPSELKKLPHFPAMAEAAKRMVSASLDAFVTSDAAAAAKVIEMDDEVDNLFLSIKKELVEFIGSGGENGETAVDMLMVAKYLERIGDHAQNVAEWVEYAVTGLYKGKPLMA